jgi:MoaA/NifB/PqqE/SkfB family radical SAM enzyme
MTEPLIQIFSQQSLSQPSSVRPASSGSFAMGLGLTNECNLACSFCYRDPARVDRLSLDQVRSAMESLPVRSVNLGTVGEANHYLKWA